MYHLLMFVVISLACDGHLWANSRKLIFGPSYFVSFSSVPWLTWRRHFSSPPMIIAVNIAANQDATSGLQAPQAIEVSAKTLLLI